MATEQGDWWYCLRHRRVEPRAGCKNADRLGPYATQAEAEQALERVAERNEEWDEDNARWEGER